MVEQRKELREKALLDLYGISSKIDNDPITQKKMKINNQKTTKEQV